MGKFKRRLELFFLGVLCRVYLMTFPKLDRLIVLLPEAELSFERASGQYSEPRAAELRLACYRQALGTWRRFRGEGTAIEITKDMEIEDVKTEVLNQMDIKHA